MSENVILKSRVFKLISRLENCEIEDVEMLKMIFSHTC